MRQDDGGMLRDDHSHYYCQEGDTWLVEIRVDRLEQLFSNLDPAPFWRRDLDPAAADYILESVQELPRRAPVKLVVHVEVEHPANAQEHVSSTLNSFFRYRAKVNRQRLRLELRRGRISLLVGLSFLALCFGVGNYVEGLETIGSTIIRESLLIMGWVAMWQPLQIFLYDWWPHLGRARLYDRVARMPVEIRRPGTERCAPSMPEAAS